MFAPSRPHAIVNRWATTAFAIAIMSGQALAGAWTEDAGHGQIIATGSFSNGDRLFDAQGKLIPVADYRKFDVPVLIEYGVTDWLTLIAAPSLLATSVGAPANEQRTGLGVTEIGGRVRVWRNQTSVFSVQAVARVPAMQGALPPGDPDRSFQTDLRALYGHAFEIGGLNGFVNAELAYRVSAGVARDEIRMDVTLGIRPAEDWLVLLQSFNRISASQWDPAARRLAQSKLAASLVYTITPKWSVQFGGFTTVAGTNTLHESGLLAGLWRRF